MYMHPTDLSNCYFPTKDAIKVWKFNDAPEYLRNLSNNGGDEDWLAVIPPGYKDEWIPWMESGSEFGCCCVDEYDYPSLTLKGFKVRIGSHA